MNAREELEILKRGVEHALDCFYERNSKLIRLNPTFHVRLDGELFSRRNAA